MSTIFKVGVLDSIIANAYETKIESGVLAGVAEVVRYEVVNESELPADFFDLDAIII